jgi:hypothetical protein
MVPRNDRFTPITSRVSAAPERAHSLTEVPQLHRVVLVRIRGIATVRPLLNEDNRYARIRPLTGGLARQRTLITTAVRIVGDSRRFLVLAGGGKPPTAP